MARGDDRIARIKEALEQTQLDALVCALPTNVLLLSGYWPVVGTALALATRDGQVAVLTPEDERELAELGWAARVETYAPGSLTRLTSAEVEAREPLAALLRALGFGEGRIALRDGARARIGCEDGAVFESSSYAATHRFQAAIMDVLRAAVPQATVVSGADALGWLRAVLTPDEVARVRLACAIAGEAFTTATRGLRPGQRESEVAAAYTAPLSVLGQAHAGVARAGGFVYCMSGPNSALAGGAYARTRDRELRVGDLVLVHCNSYVDGYWTDITRTYCLGEPDERQRAMFAAIAEARAAAIAAIHPGAHAADVDQAARAVLTRHGFGDNFTHGVGHNVGFSVISADYPPRLHPASPDTLEVGMTFNIEPAIYIQGYGGMRHCDVVTLGPQGTAEVLTPFQAGVTDLVVHN